MRAYSGMTNLFNWFAWYKLSYLLDEYFACQLLSLPKIAKSHYFEAWKVAWKSINKMVIIQQWIIYFLQFFDISYATKFSGITKNWRIKITNQTPLNFLGKFLRLSLDTFMWPFLSPSTLNNMYNYIWHCFRKTHNLTNFDTINNYWAACHENRFGLSCLRRQSQWKYPINVSILKVTIWKS